MAARVGVDVGGTFTKAVAVDTESGLVVGRAVTPTTHSHADGVAAGVVSVVAQLAEELGPNAITLVTHSTTQAVNALLEGDVVTVGVIGMARAPNVAKSRRRTALGSVPLGDQRALKTIGEFIDVTDGLDEAAAGGALARLVDAGAGAVAIAEAFAPDDSSNEAAVAAMAAEVGLPATTSAELSGLYGLELRTVTAAVNASILPIALRTAEVVRAGVVAAGIVAPVMVMRGDGGATDLDGFRKAPARTLYSGPAASVAGALRTARIDDGVIVEVGGTSTNVAAIKAGQPVLSYVQVAGRATAIRALDVRVAGVAGGSMLRSRGKGVYGIGPRSAHITGLAYCCFLSPAELEGANVTRMSPRAGDPADYVVLRLADGRLAALTNTCAANALGLVEPGDYALANGDAARTGFAVAATTLRLGADEIARRMLEASCTAVGDLVAAVAKAHHLAAPTIVAVGGGAGALGRQVASALGLTCVVPEGAEVISSIGDALSMVRAERERTLANPGPADIQALADEAEAEALAAGASPTTLDIRVNYETQRGSLRAVATGALTLKSGALPGRPPIGRDEAVALARARGCDNVAAVGASWVARSSNDGKGRVLVFDRFGDVVVELEGEVMCIDGQSNGDFAGSLNSMVSRQLRHLGPVTVRPSVWVVRGARVFELPDGDPTAVVTALTTTGTSYETMAVIAGRT